MTTSSKMFIIGVAGTFASGKDTFAHHLVADYDFYHVSTSDMVRAVAMEQYGDTERPTLQKTANELRQNRGAGVLVDLAIEAFEQKKEMYKGMVISGIRSIGEAKKLKERGGTLVFIDAPIEIRYQRAVARKRANEEVLNFDEFKASEDQEMSQANSSDDTLQNIGEVRKLADTVLVNGATVKEFYSIIEKFMN